jgi:hypothetical protein
MTTYDNPTLVNQVVHLIIKLVSMKFDESKGTTEHLLLVTGTLSKLQDSGLPAFNDKLKAIF